MGLCKTMSPYQLRWRSTQIGVGRRFGIMVIIWAFTDDHHYVLMDEGTTNQTKYHLG
jgi:hypothetical protein